ncbi:MAG: polysaccharide biosynthesis/export family protein [Roseinatronobacter sp.]
MHNILRAILVVLALTSGARAAEYVLGPQDVVMVRVGHWDAVLGAYVAWTDMNGEYTVTPDGALALPLAGRIMAAGQDAGTVATTIATALRNQLVSREEVQVTVDVVGYRPVYVLGAVRTPGAYPYAPGMTVLQAIGLAGGLSQARVEFQRNARTALASLGNYEVLSLALQRRLATEARLVAETDGQGRVEMPPDLEGTGMGTELMAREREIFAARNAALASALSQLDGLERLLQQQIEQMTSQVALRERQLDLATEEMDNITDLVARGLSVAARRIELESRVADQEVRLLELATARLNAEQRLNEVRRERLDLVNTRAREVAEQLLTIRTEIAEYRIRLRTEAALYAEATQYEDGYMQMEGLGSPDMMLTRGNADAVPVARSDMIQPGDVLELVLPLPGQDAFGTTRAARPVLQTQR